MTLSSPTRIGPYEVVGLLGVGGMGEVYRARDVRLGRQVAIKILPASVARDRERLARFDRECRLLAALNHPSIATVYGIEPGDPSPALVMELVEGPTLHERIAAAPLPVEEAMAIARQIAEALEHAHELGIVHRDLKPANVKVSDAGAVKVLDFGLARALETSEAGAEFDLSNSPTKSEHMTEAGSILGTAGYMAPEQAKGRPADRRADIWSFGVLLFEMLTGRPLFKGESASDTLASVIKDEIPWTRLPADVPAPIRRLLERCLTRDPRQRLQSIAEARITLESPVGEQRDTGRSDADTRRAAGRQFVAAAVMIALALAGALAGAWIASSRGPAPAVRRYPLSLSGNPRAAVDPAISPDGRRVAYLQGESLYVRDFATLEVRLLGPAIGTVLRPFWSPDGREIGYTNGTTLMRVAAAGGEAVPIGTIPSGASGVAGASWADPGRIVMALGHRGLWEMPLSGGTPREFLPPDSSSSDYHEAVALPAGRGVLFLRHRKDSEVDRIAVWNGRVWYDVYEAQTGTLRRPAWSRTGHVLFQRLLPGNPAGLWALPFSLSSLRPTGEAFLVDPQGATASASDAGALLYAIEPVIAGPTTLTWVDRSGRRTPAFRGDLGSVHSIALSPDGIRVAVSATNEGSTDLWTVDLASGARTRLTTPPTRAVDPCWTGDGSEIFFTKGDGIFAIPAGGGTARRVASGSSPSLSPDGRWLCYTFENEATDQDLYLRRLGGGNVDAPIVQSPRPDVSAAISPDGRWLAYTTIVTQSEVFITRIPEGGAGWQISAQGGRRERWSRDSRRLYFTSNDNRFLMEAAIAPAPAPNPAPPRLLFDLRELGTSPRSSRPYDLAPDGRFLLVTVPHAAPREGDAVLLEGWSRPSEAR